MADEEVQKFVKDSLKRQIIEVKKQIEEAKNKELLQQLAQQHITDKSKTRRLIHHLNLRKIIHDYKLEIQQTKKQWELEIHQSQISLMKYQNYLQRQKILRVKTLEDIYALLEIGNQESFRYPEGLSLGSCQDEDITRRLPQDFQEVNRTIRMKSVSDFQHPNQKFLSANLMAVIQGNLEHRRSEEAVFQSLKGIKRDIRNWLASQMRECQIQAVEIDNTLEQSSVLEFKKESEESQKVQESSDKEEMESIAESSVLNFHTNISEEILSSDRFILIHSEEAAHQIEKRPLASTACQTEPIPKSSWVKKLCSCFYSK